MPSELPTLFPRPSPDFPSVQIKSTPEDFIVEEIPLYEPSGSGTHTYFWIEKRGSNTRDAVQRIAKSIGKRAADAGIAGLKDAQSVSRQWISFEHVKQGLESVSRLSEPKLKVLSLSAHGNKLKMGHLRGNRFIITLRLNRDDPAERSRLAQRANDVCAALSRRGMPNYFGPQRFGWNGDNIALGKLLVLGDKAGFDREWLQRNPNRPADRKLRNLIVNAYQSELFNRVLARRIQNLSKLLPGDLAWLHRNGAVFRVSSRDDVQREQPRADALEISPSGPLFGPKMINPEGEPAQMEAEILAAESVTCADFGRVEAEHQPGARRPLRVPFLETPVVEECADGVRLRVALPPGSYATVLLAEILGAGDNSQNVE
jgi:tRNA pseudouridine13 synthase